MRPQTTRTREALRIIQARRAEAEARRRSAISLLSDEGNPPPVDRVWVAIPVFAGLNLFLMAAAIALSHNHYDPRASQSGIRWRERFGEAWQDRRKRAAARRLRRERERRAKRAATDQAEVVTRAEAAARAHRLDVEVRARELANLRAAVQSVDEAAKELLQVTAPAAAKRKTSTDRWSRATGMPKTDMPSVGHND